MRKEPGFLEHITEAAFLGRQVDAARGIEQGRAADTDAATIRPQQPGERVDHAGLADAGAAEERGDAAFRGFEPRGEHEAAELFFDGDLDQSRPRKRWPRRRARSSEPISAARASATER